MPGRQAAGGLRPRGSSSENFPVASRLLPARARGPVMAFYRFARAADDVADDPARGPSEKLALLDAFEAGLDGGAGPPEASALRAAVGCSAEGLAPARDLLDAFRMDAAGHRYETWEDLMGYCALSADPVGRFLLLVHGEPAGTARLTDPLCSALQVLNHLQDLAEDRAQIDRVYMPGAWLSAEGVAPGDLARDAATPGLRRVIDRALDGCDALLARAAPLPGALRDAGLRAQSRATLRLAGDLSAALRRNDPLARRVQPGRWRVAAAVLRAGLLRAAGR